jgi:hypothetical protein
MVHPRFVVQVQTWRAVAERARRLAEGLLIDTDRDRLLDYAKELDEKAARLDVQERRTDPSGKQHHG